jgi:16S rRNA (uracil1498-N3)-methyltransferase
VEITVYQGLPKAEKMELVVQKLTELGAARLVPVKMERCVVKLDEKDGKKRRERLQKIAREAAKQCKRGGCLEVTEPQTWKQLQEALRGHDLLLTPWEDANGYGMKAARAEFPDAKRIGIVIGPEGGMSEGEVSALEALGGKTVTLGPRILRTETAAIASCAMAMLLWGDLG